MTISVGARLDEALARLARATLARAAQARFARINDGGRISTVLQLTPDARIAAVDEYEQFRRWIRAVASVLDRRGASPAARRIELLAADLDPLVRCRRKDVAEIIESSWRHAYAEELASLTARLSATIAQHAPLFDLVQRAGRTEYINKHITISHLHSDRYTARVNGHNVEVEVSLLDRAGNDGRTAVHYGRTLYDAVLATADQPAAPQRNPEGAIRYTLWLDHAGPLAAAPWELLHDGNEFLALRRATSVVRGVVSAATPQAPARPTPLRLLITISAPAGVEMLEAQHERAAAEAALAPLVLLGLAEVEIAPDGRLETLRRLVRAAADGGKPFDVWHHIGHGSYDEVTGSSALLMEGDRQDVHQVGGEELGLLFRSYGALSFVFLNCCHGGRGDASTRIAVPARALVAAGVPSVVAMQSTIRDDAASVFAEELYGALCDGRSVDDAVAEGRRRLFLSPGGLHREWSTPVLFTGAPATASMSSHRSGKAQT